MLHSNRIFALGFLLFLFIPACAGPGIKPEPVKGIYHVVKKGETLWSISRAYHVSLQEVAEINNITNAASIEAGHVIFIPGAEKTVDRIPVPEQRAAAKKPPDPKEPSRKQVARKDPVRNMPARTAKTTAAPPARKAPAEPEPQATASKPERAEQPGTGTPAEAARDHEKLSGKPEPQKTESLPDQDRIEFDRKRFIWPAKGTVVSKYGIQPNGLKHNGIKIGAKDGAPVLAAASGEVTYSDTLKYYGETIIVKHDENFSTVYTTLKSRGVRKGDRVKKGDRIAAVGKSDANGQPSLNFEVRQMNKPRNPLFFLP